MKTLKTVVCLLLVLVVSSAVAFGQNAPPQSNIPTVTSGVSMAPVVKPFRIAGFGLAWKKVTMANVPIGGEIRRLPDGLNPIFYEMMAQVKKPKVNPGPMKDMLFINIEPLANGTPDAQFIFEMASPEYEKNLIQRVDPKLPLAMIEITDPTVFKYADMTANAGKLDIVNNGVKLPTHLYFKSQPYFLNHIKIFRTDGVYMAIKPIKITGTSLEYEWKIWANPVIQPVPVVVAGS